MRRLALPVLLLLATPALGQLRFWANGTSGVWDDPGNWTLDDAPDTSRESAIFDRFGAFNVSLPDTGPITIDDWRVEYGSPRFQSAGFGQATLNVRGDASLAGMARLHDGVGSLAVNLDGSLRVEGSASVDLDEVTVTAGPTLVATPTTATPTQLTLRNGAIAAFGSLEIAPTAAGATAARSGVDLSGGSTLSVGELLIATSTSDAIGELNVLSSQLNQDPQQSTTVGVADAEAGTRASLVIGGTGSADLGSLWIRGTGLVQNAGGTLAAQRSIVIEGGAFVETGGAVRDFTALTQFRVSDGGRADLVGAGLTIGTGQELAVIDGSFSSTGGLLIQEGGTLSVGGVGETVVAADTTLEADSRLTVGKNGSTRFTGGFDDRGAAIRLLDGAVLSFAAAYTGSGADGTGRLLFEGETRLGGGPGGSQYATSLEWADSARTTLTLGDPPPAGEALVSTDAEAALDGSLVLNASRPLTIGDTFRLIDAASLTGSFDGMLVPPLPPGRDWTLTQTATSLTARVVAPSIPGDFNRDGLVDAADYSIWRDTLGSEGPWLAADANGDLVVDALDRDAWRAAYGSRAPAIAVPEPATWLALLATACGILRRRRSLPPR